MNFIFSDTSVILCLVNCISKISFGSVLIMAIILLTGCASEEEKRLREAIKEAEAAPEASEDPYVDPYFLEQSKLKLKEILEGRDLPEVLEIYNRLDERGQELLLEEVDEETSERIKSLGPSRGQQDNQILMPVFFGTNRKPRESENPEKVFSIGKPTDSLYLGKCIVSIPPIHVLGEIERPSFFKMEFVVKDDEHMYLKELSLNTKDDFLQSFEYLYERQAFVFIHGYNNSFEDAALRTAQIAYDLNYPGVPLFYSWPSQGSLKGYFEDEKTIETSVGYLYRFLKILAESKSFDKINVIAHSMGNRATLQTMLKFAEESESPVFNHLILAAPDVDAEVFRDDIAPYLEESARDVTLYSSSQDVALKVSSMVNSRARAGLGGAKVLVVDGIETVDASAISTDLFGHGYFYNSWVLVEDVKQLLLQDQKADQRGLDSRELDVYKYWLLNVDE